MAWERRQNTTAYYRGIREGTRVRKVYCGTGLVGRLAAQEDARRSEARREQHLVWLADQKRLDALREGSARLNRVCNLIAEAALLAVGYHRPYRFSWRPWHAARQYE